MVGFPPADDSLVTLSTWQDPPNVRWAFQHMREIIPTQLIPAGPAPRPLPTDLDASVSETPLTRLDGSAATAGDVFADTWTDAVLVLHDGELVEERYFGEMTAATPHLLMSVTKSFVGCVAGILTGQGLVDPEAPITKYVPEVADSGYDGATVRHLLDMRSGVAFREAYVEPDAEVRVMERSMGWRPLLEGDPAGMYDYLTTLGTAGEHGGDFTYRSADTDMLGWVLERASGTRMAELVSSLIWVPLGAEHDADITCDPVGSAIHDGGMSATARDLARFGQLLLDDGFVDGHAVVPADLVGRCPEPHPRRTRGVRQHRQRGGADGRLVPQQVLVRARTGRGCAGVPRHPRPDGLRQPRHPDRRREAVVVARRAEQQLPDRHAAGLRRDRCPAEHRHLRPLLTSPWGGARLRE